MKNIVFLGGKGEHFGTFHQQRIIWVLNRHRVRLSTRSTNDAFEGMIFVYLSC